MVTGIERLHGAFVEWRRTSGALGHGTGPWDDVTGTLKRYVHVDETLQFTLSKLAGDA